MAESGRSKVAQIKWDKTIRMVRHKRVFSNMAKYSVPAETVKEKAKKQMLVQVVGALLASQLKDTIGWKGLLFIGAGGVIISLLLCIAMLVHHRRSRRTTRKAVL